VTPAMIPTASDNTQSQVLIVDNDPQTARVVLGVLARRAIHGTLADKPQKALDYADRNIWKLALIDRAFAESSAEITCRRLLARLKSRHPELPVIMLIDGSTRSCRITRQRSWLIPGKAAFRPAESSAAVGLWRQRWNSPGRWLQRRRRS